METRLSRCCDSARVSRAPRRRGSSFLTADVRVDRTTGDSFAEHDAPEVRRFRERSRSEEGGPAGDCSTRPRRSSRRAGATTRRSPASSNVRASRRGPSAFISGSTREIVEQLVGDLNCRLREAMPKGGRRQRGSARRRATRLRRLLRVRERPQLPYELAWRRTALTVADRWSASSKIHHGCGCRLIEPEKLARQLVCATTGHECMVVVARMLGHVPRGGAARTDPRLRTQPGAGHYSQSVDVVSKSSLSAGITQTKSPAGSRSTTHVSTGPTTVAPAATSLRTSASTSFVAMSTW